MSGKILTKADILAVDDLKLQRVSVPEWGGDVFIRVMSGTERDVYEDWAVKSGATLKGIRGRMAALCLTDENGDKIFTVDDIEALGKKSAAALERVVLAIMKLSAITADDVKELEKN